MDKPERWIKNVMNKFNPVAAYLTQSWVKTTQHFLVEGELFFHGNLEL